MNDRERLEHRYLVSKPLLPKVCGPAQQHLLGAREKCRVSGPTGDLLFPNLHFNNISGDLHPHVQVRSSTANHTLTPLGLSVYPQPELGWRLSPFLEKHLLSNLTAEADIKTHIHRKGKCK